MRPFNLSNLGNDTCDVIDCVLLSERISCFFIQQLNPVAGNNICPTSFHYVDNLTLLDQALICVISSMCILLVGHVDLLATGSLRFFKVRQVPNSIKPHTSMPSLWGTRAPRNRTGILDADGCERQQNKIWNARTTRRSRMTRMSRMNQ